MADSETIRLERAAGLNRLLAPSELWRYRDVAFQIAARDVKVRYRQTVLGAAWAVLQPVGTMVVFSIFFGRVAGIQSDGVPYWLFSLVALVPWTFFVDLAAARLRKPGQQLGAGLEDLLPAHLHPGRGRRRRSASTWRSRMVILLVVVADRRRRAVRRSCSRCRCLVVDHGRGGARRLERALRRQRPLPRRPLRGPVRDPALALRHPDRLPEQRCSTSRGGRCRRSTRWSAWSKASAGRCCGTGSAPGR